MTIEKRERKFKFYCSRCLRWHHITLEELCEAKAKDFRICHEDGFNVSGFQEYTGLKDKKRTKEYPEGEEIYEGDILKVGRVGSVYFDFITAAFQIKLVLTETDIAFDVRNASLYGWVTIGTEVIGNICQNPELLEGR